MTEIVYLEYGWFPLPPAPLNHASISSIRSLCNKYIFAYDGTNGSVFSFEDLEWSNPVAYPSLSFTTFGWGLRMSQVFSNRFVLVDCTNSPFNTYLCSIESGVLKTLPSMGGTIVSSNFAGYEGSPFAFPPALYESANTIFYLPQFPHWLFYLATATEGPNTPLYICVELLTGLPLFHFPPSYDLTGAAELFNAGYPGTRLYNGGSSGPYSPGSTYFTNEDVAKYIQDAGLLNEFGWIKVNGITYQCPAEQATTIENVYEVTGFYGSIAAFYNEENTGAITENFLYLLNVNEVPFNYTPFTMLAPLFQVGEFSLGLTLPPPEPIPTNVYVYQRFLTHVYSDNVFGYFLADYSGGWYLGIGQASFNVFTLLNYVRADT